MLYGEHSTPQWLALSDNLANLGTGKAPALRQHKPYYTFVFARPLRRRRKSVFLPPGVLVRFKKPWARARFRFLGWYVCDIQETIAYPQFLHTFVHKSTVLTRGWAERIVV